MKIAKEKIENNDENYLIISIQILRRILIMLSCAIPFKTEELYQKINFENKLESIFLERLKDV